MRVRECLVGVGALTCYETIAPMQAFLTYATARLVEELLRASLEACSRVSPSNVSGCLESLEF